MSSLDFRCRPPHNHKKHEEMRKRHQHSKKDESILINSYEDVFPSGNRNAAAYKWSDWLLRNSHDFSASKLEKLFSMFCGVSGAYLSPEEGSFPQSHARWLVTLDKVNGGDQKGFLYHCTGCKGWPCLCDAKDFVKIDTKTVTLKGGKTKQYSFAVLGDPCKHPEALKEPFWEPLDNKEETIEESAPEVKCSSDGVLEGAQKSDNGHIILTMFHDYNGDAKANDESEYNKRCKEREESGFASGMGMIFRKFAGITPLDKKAEAKAKLEPQKPAHPGDQGKRQAFGSSSEGNSGGEKNIYGRELVPCKENPGSSAEGGLCSYAQEADDPGRHQVCVTSLPEHFSRKGGQGDWSEPETGREWCACIWAYANWVLNHDVNKLPVKCDAVTERVLVSDYAMQAWASCGQMSSACNGYKKALETLCSHCKSDDQAPDDDAKQELDQKCKHMYAAAAEYKSED